MAYQQIDKSRIEASDDNKEPFILDPDCFDGYPSHGGKIVNPDINIKRCFKVLDKNVTEGYPSFGHDTKFLTESKYIIAVDKKYNEGYPSFRHNPEFLKDSKYIMKIDPDYNDGYASFRKKVAEPDEWTKYIMSTNWRGINDNYPSFRRYTRHSGAFENTSGLRSVIIPKTVKYIRDYSFYGSGIKEVTIAKDCEYFEHSFPEDCVISFYEDD